MPKWQYLSKTSCQKHKVNSSFSKWLASKRCLLFMSPWSFRSWWNAWLQKTKRLLIFALQVAFVLYAYAWHSSLENEKVFCLFFKFQIRVIDWFQNHLFFRRNFLVIFLHFTLNDEIIFYLLQYINFKWILKFE